MSSPAWYAELAKTQKDEVAWLYDNTLGCGYWHDSLAAARKRELLEADDWLTVSRWVDYCRWRLEKGPRLRVVSGSYQLVREAP